MGFDTIPCSDLDKYIGQYNTLIIDLRNRSAYSMGHVPTAINIPYDELEYMKYTLPRDAVLIFYCERGHISLMAARDLVKEGFMIKSVYGGLRTYRGRLDK